MTDENLPAKTGKKANRTSFKPGYDPRRWLKGRGKKSPEQREADAILRAVIWEELAREFDKRTMTPLEEEEVVDALRLTIRSLLKKKPEILLERIAGKVTDKVDVTSKGKPLTTIGVRYIDYRNGIAAAPSRPGGDSAASGEDESSGDG